NALELRTDKSSDGNAGQIRMRIEIARFTRQRGAIRGAVNSSRQVSERRLHRESDPRSVEGLVIPRSLDRQQAHVHRHPDTQRKNKLRARWPAHITAIRAIDTISPPRK